MMSHISLCGLGVVTNTVSIMSDTFIHICASVGFITTSNVCVLFRVSVSCLKVQNFRNKFSSVMQRKT